MLDRYKNKLFSILGDSMSTYEGLLPTDYPAFYTHSIAFTAGISGWDKTWWGQVIKYFGAELLVNNSWSGSFVTRPYGCEIESFGCSDARTGGLGFDAVDPDCIIVFLGANDRGFGVQLTGEKEDLTAFDNAYSLMLDKIKRNYPNAEIWCLTLPITTCTAEPGFIFPETHRGISSESYGIEIKRMADKKQCRVIDLWDREEPCDTIEGLHPNYKGMCTIASRVVSAMSDIHL